MSDSALSLMRILSTRTVHSTTSSYAERMQEAARRLATDRSSFRNIGLGSCGSVFEVPLTILAYKKGSKEAEIARDYSLTTRVSEAMGLMREILEDHFKELNVPKTPKCFSFHDATDVQFWEDNLQRFPQSHRSKQPLFAFEHILPMPLSIREALIKDYFDEDDEIQQEAREDQDNKDCLIRLYMGERETIRQQSDGYDTLRNFPMRLNMMEDHELDVNLWAKEMALGLAIIHWQAQIDGMDMEFVLGSSAKTDMSPLTAASTSESINFMRRQLDMWILDFDKASEFELNKHDVKTKLVSAFLGNDPYYPRPGVDMELWDGFCETYLEASELILRERGVDHSKRLLPSLFLEEVTRVLKENEEWNEEDNIVFAN